MGTRRQREAPEIGAAAIRMIEALVRRASEGDAEALEALARIEEHAPRALGRAVVGMHAAEFSYTYIGEVLGVTKQAARHRATTSERSAAIAAEPTHSP